MPHQCVRCAKLYPDGSKELLAGCECGGKFFFYVRKQNVKDAEEIAINLTDKEKVQIEKDVQEIIGEDYDSDKPVVLDLESIRISSPGKYQINLVDLFKGKPLVYKLGEGKYMIDILQTFESLKEKKKD